jgi:carbamoyl-phosphate synthase small subunit
VVRRLRETGTQRGVLRQASEGGFTSSQLEQLRQAARQAPMVSQLELVSDVSAVLPVKEHGELALLDCGAKWNIVRSLQSRGVQPRIFPWTATAEEILETKPRAILVSNGPGDPAKLDTVVAQVKKLVRSGVPLLGICLGHQVLGLAAGAQTARLPYGHHGGNHPVRELDTGRVTITTQNHEFQVLANTLPEASGFEVSHINLNDGSVEGLKHRELPVFSVQYHPEGAPGPQDSQGLFDDLPRRAGSPHGVAAISHGAAGGSHGASAISHGASAISHGAAGSSHGVADSHGEWSEP